MGWICFKKNVFLGVNVIIIDLMMAFFCQCVYAGALVVELSGGKCAEDQ